MKLRGHSRQNKANKDNNSSLPITNTMSNELREDKIESKSDKKDDLSCNDESENVVKETDLSNKEDNEVKAVVSPPDKANTTLNNHNKMINQPCLVIFSDDSMFIWENGEEDAIIKWQAEGNIKRCINGQIEELEITKKVFSNEGYACVEPEFNLAALAKARLNNCKPVLVKFSDGSAVLDPLGEEHAKMLLKEDWCKPVDYEKGRNELLLKQLETVYNESVKVPFSIATKVKREIFKTPDDKRYDSTYRPDRNISNYN